MAAGLLVSSWYGSRCLFRQLEPRTFQGGHQTEEEQRMTNKSMTNKSSGQRPAQSIQDDDDAMEHLHYNHIYS
jgi:hypothetical protein